MEARSSGHLDACVERRRDALLGRRGRKGDVLCSARARFSGKVLTAIKKKKNKKRQILIHDFSTKFPSHPFFLIFRNKIKVIQRILQTRISQFHSQQHSKKQYFNTFREILNLNHEK